MPRSTGAAIAVRNGGRARYRHRLLTGCAVCCGQKDIPVYPHELVGIYWYASEKLGAGDRRGLKERLANHGAGAPCPFLVHSACSIHPVRPAACRWFNIFGAACSPGEDPYYSRRDDVLVPIDDYTDRAFTAVLSFYTIKRNDDLTRSLRFVRSQIMNLQAYDWSKLLQAMGNRDA
jgi:Fe-S-cluster containining protein